MKTISIEAGRCPICRHPAKPEDYSARKTHLCTVSGCVCPRTSTRAEKAAVALRIAALEFAHQPREPKDMNDTAGQRANQKLLNAAVRYADARETPTRAEEVPS